MPTTLIAVSGASPAILTETLWALARERPAVIPDEVIVLTTLRGARDIQEQLLAGREDWGGLSVWAALRQSLLPQGRKKSAAQDLRLQLASPRVIDLPDPATGVKRPAEDLRSPGDNAAAADFILEEVRRLTENPDIHLIASIAGGRKTMGALLYAAMSLLGREGDRLTHVLVNEPFEQCRGFFYPGQPHQPTMPGRAQPLRAADARIDLADIPFVPLRNLFERDLRRPGSFASLVAEASHKLKKIPCNTRVFKDRPMASIEGVEVRFSAREFVLFFLLAEARAKKQPYFRDHDRTHEAYEARARELREKADPNDFSDWRGEISKGQGGKNVIDSSDIRKILSHIRRKLKAAGAPGRSLERELVSKQGVGFSEETTFTIC